MQTGLGVQRASRPGLEPESRQRQRRSGKACHYEPNKAMTSCLKNSEVVVWMCGRRASPKERHVCSSCARWLIGGRLAVLSEESETPAGEPTPLASVSHPGTLDTPGGNLRLREALRLGDQLVACRLRPSGRTICAQTEVRRHWCNA